MPKDTRLGHPKEGPLPNGSAGQDPDTRPDPVQTMASNDRLNADMMLRGRNFRWGLLAVFGIVAILALFFTLFPQGNPDALRYQTAGRYSYYASFTYSGGQPVRLASTIEVQLGENARSYILLDAAFPAEWEMDGFEPVLVQLGESTEFAAPNGVLLTCTPLDEPVPGNNGA